MKKKRYFQLNIGWQLIALFFLTIAIIGIYIVIRSFIESNFLVVFLLVLPVIFCFYTFIRFEHNRIVLNEEYIFMPGDWMFWKEKIQYKVTIRYDEINEINLVKANTNSLSKRIKRVSPIFPLTFLEFKCNDGTYKRIFILYHTKKQRIRMLEEIKTRMKVAGNNTEITSTSDLLNDILTYE